MHLADGRFVVRRAAVDAPEIASFVVGDAVVAIDPRGERIAVATGSQLTLLGMSGIEEKAADLAPGFAVKDIAYRADGERLWVFGTVGASFHAHAFDRALTPSGAYALTLAQGPYPTGLDVHPTEDAFLLTTNEDGRDQDASIHRIGARVEGGALRVLFDHGDIDHPCVGFTRDGSAFVGVDAFNGVTLWRWPDHERIDEALLPEGDESRFDGAVIGDHLLTERHAAGTSDSALMVLAVPSLTQEALITWSTRGDFGAPDDDAGADLGGALGADCFLEVKSGASEGAWILRVWRLSAR